MVEVNMEGLKTSLSNFKGASPFHHCVVDQFFSTPFAQRLEDEFPDYDDRAWHVYCNPLENKKTLNDWNRFPPATYQTFHYLCSEEFLQNVLRTSLGLPLFPDFGLHGGGWHIHGQGGNLNPHFDYHLHPKLGMVRKLNLIIYLSSMLDPVLHGGELGFWEHDSILHRPGNLAKTISPLFNRAVLFDTTQNSWHGMVKPLSIPAGIFRKSLAVYYVIPAEEKDRTERKRALYAAREEQRNDPNIEEIIKKRVDEKRFGEVYKT